MSRPVIKLKWYEDICPRLSKAVSYSICDECDDCWLMNINLKTTICGFKEHTKFPYLNNCIREDYPETTGAIDDWFKRCIKDFPEYQSVCYENDGSMTVIKHPPIINKWFNKWFGQFKEEVLVE